MENLKPVNPDSQSVVAAKPAAPAKPVPANFHLHTEINGELVKATYTTAARRDNEFRRLKNSGYNPKAFDVAPSTEQPAQE